MQPEKFYEILPDGRYRFRVDHHIINDYNTCDRYFQFRHIGDSAGLVWGGKTLKLKIALGSWWSSTMELLYHEMSHGTFPSEHHVFKFASDAWLEHKIEDFKNSEPEVFDKFGGLDGGRLMALEYYNEYAKAHFSNWKIVGPELGFGWHDELYLGEDDKVVVYYGGKPDLTIIDLASNMLLPLDHKTKDSIPYDVTSMFKPHPQTAGYIFALRELLHKTANLGDVKPPNRCIIMVAARLRPTEKPRSGVRRPRFVPVYPSYSLAEIEEWRTSVVWKCRKLRESIEEDFFPPRESACHTYNNGCMFRRVCSTPANSRDMILKADFVKINPWVPYHVED